MDQKTISTPGGIDKQLFEYHPIIGYRFIPNLQTRVQHESGGYLVKTNSLGFRSEVEFNPIKKKGHKRVLLFGDSFTESDGVSNKKRYSDLLIQMLPSTEVFNFGLRGTGTDQQYLIYKEYAKNIEHDLIMIVVYIENIRRVNAKYRFYLNAQNEKVVFQKPYFELENSQLVLKNTPVDPLQLKLEELPVDEKSMVVKGNRFPAFRSIIRQLGLKTIAQRITNYQQYHEYSSSKSKEWLLLKAILKKWINEINGPVLLVPLPTNEYLDGQSDFREIEKRFMEFDGMDKVTVYSPLSDLKKYSLEQRRKFRFEQDVHPTPSGHEAYAKAFKPKIEAILKNEIAG